MRHWKAPETVAVRPVNPNAITRGDTLGRTGGRPACTPQCNRLKSAEHELGGDRFDGKPFEGAWRCCVLVRAASDSRTFAPNTDTESPVANAGAVFVGPPPSVLDAFGDKAVGGGGASGCKWWPGASDVLGPRARRVLVGRRRAQWGRRANGREVCWAHDGETFRDGADDTAGGYRVGPEWPDRGHRRDGIDCRGGGNCQFAASWGH